MITLQHQSSLRPQQKGNHLHFGCYIFVIFLKNHQRSNSLNVNYSGLKWKVPVLRKWKKKIIIIINNKYADLRPSGGMGSKDLPIYYIHDVMMTCELMLIKEGWEWIKQNTSIVVSLLVVKIQTHVYHGKENSIIYVLVCQTQINELASGKKHNTTNLNTLLLCITFYHMR